MPASLTEVLRGEQAPGGGFACTITHPSGRVEADVNGFATALVLRRLRTMRAEEGAAGPGLDPGLQTIRRDALDFLERCAAPEPVGAFGFWPVAERPAWARRVPADNDDTAVIALELLAAGRRTLDETTDSTVGVLAGSLLTGRPAPAGPRWIRPMVFPTWLGRDGAARRNVVDCAVNANVVALLHACGLDELPGYLEAIAMIEDGIRRAGSTAPRLLNASLRALAPYYPDPGVFLAMVEHAVACGVDGLAGSAEALRGLVARSEPPAGAVGALCGNAYGGPRWRCAALARIDGRRR